MINNTKTIYLRDNITTSYKAVLADAGCQDGGNPHAVIFDELHWRKNRDLWDILTYGSDTREQPLTIAITTAGIERARAGRVRPASARRMILRTASLPTMGRRAWTGE